MADGGSVWRTGWNLGSTSISVSGLGEGRRGAVGRSVVISMCGTAKGKEGRKIEARRQSSSVVAGRGAKMLVALCWRVASV